MNHQDTKSTEEELEELDPIANRVIGAAIEVHYHLGPGFLESAYEEAMLIELAARSIAVERQAPICVHYKNRKIAEGRIDLLVECRLVVELKTVVELVPIHVAQVLAYLKAGRFHLGLLINFNTVKVRDGIRRIIRTP